MVIDINTDCKLNKLEPSFSTGINVSDKVCNEIANNIIYDLKNEFELHKEEIKSIIIDTMVFTYLKYRNHLEICLKGEQQPIYYKDLELLLQNDCYPFTSEMIFSNIICKYTDTYLNSFISIHNKLDLTTTIYYYNKYKEQVMLILLDKYYSLFDFEIFYELEEMKINDLIKLASDNSRKCEFMNYKKIWNFVSCDPFSPWLVIPNYI